MARQRLEVGRQANERVADVDGRLGCLSHGVPHRPKQRRVYVPCSDEAVAATRRLRWLCGNTIEELRSDTRFFRRATRLTGLTQRVRVVIRVVAYSGERGAVVFARFGRVGQGDDRP